MAFTGSNPNHVLVGLGGTGGKVLKAFKKRLYREYPDDKKRLSLTPAIGFIYVDSTDEMMKPNDPTFRVLGKDASFKPNEFVYIKSVDLGQILNNIDTFPGLKYVVKSAESMRTTLGEVGAAAGQKRRAGRILFASNCNKYLATLASKYNELKERTRQDSLHVHIFTGLAGGTGSGAIVDVVAQTRMKYPEATIDVYAMVPEKDIPSGCQAGRYHQNGYAALKELSALNVCKFLPSNVISGEEHVVFNEVPNKQFGLMLYSNVNENGIVVDSFTELPDLLADTVFFRLFLKEKAGVNDNFLRAWSAENYNDFLVEYNFKSKSGDKERARTKAVSSFGIKRVIYPEARIIEHISYTVSECLVRQMQFNNFSDDTGYRNEAAHTDYSERTTKDEGRMREWKLDDSHLRLNEKILESEKAVKAIEAFWQDTAYFNSYDDAKQGDSKNPCAFNYTFCNDTYENKFRLKMGVENYYKEKSDDKVIGEYVLQIIENIEKHLYTKWYEGQYSMTDLLGICEVILDYIKKRAEKLPEEITKFDEQATEFLADHNDIIDEFSSLGLLSKAIGKKGDLYTEDQTVLSKLFAAKTNKIAAEFQERLMSKLRAAFEEFQSQIMLFIGKLLRSQEVLINAISDRTRQTSGLDIHQSIIEVAEDNKMSKFEQTLTRNRAKMDTFASFMRKKIANGQEFAHFDDLARNIDDSTIMDIATKRGEEVDGKEKEETLYDFITAYHNQEFAKDKILGINVLEQLMKILDTDSKINDFARSIIRESGVFLKLNDGEMSKSFNNNPNPVAEPHSINRESIIICMPESEGDDKLKAFAAKLRTAMEGEFNSTDGRKINFDVSKDRMNEITIVAVKCCFPIRTLEWLPLYHKEYDDLINSKSEAGQKQARVLLHIEGDGTQLPLLEGEGEGPQGNEVIPYIFIASAPALQLVTYDKDENENEGWCTITEGDWGIKSVKLISEQFTSIMESEEFTSDLRDKIVDNVDEFLSNPDLKKSERDAAVAKINDIMREVVYKECSSTTSPKFKLYGDAAKKAIDMIQKK